MKSKSNFSPEKDIFLWLSSSCITVDYNRTIDFLPTINYLSSYLVCQLRENLYGMPENLELGIVYLARGVESTVSTIRELKSPAALEKVIISYPRSKEFQLLNSIELEMPERNSKMKDTLFLPSGLIHILPKHEQVCIPRKTLDWPNH